MKLKIFYDQRWLQAKWLPSFLHAEAVVTYPFVLFFQKKGRVQKTTLRHEIVHIRQIRSVGFLKFTALYYFELLRGLLKYRSFERAYWDNPYEKEAYQKQGALKLTEEEKKEIGREDI